NGIAKTLIGYLAATAGNKMDAEHAGVRWAVIFVFFELNRGLIYGFERFLLGTPVPWQGLAVALAAAANGVLAIILFRAMDRFRRWM
ncbi:MAG: rod shape-determining protein MreD, partial [Terriglobales bacterium]